MAGTQAVDYQCGDPDCEERGAYEVPMVCGNCGARFAGRFTNGHEAPVTLFFGRRCPTCGFREATVAW